jgi:hypothetical protein
MPTNLDTHKAPRPEAKPKLELPPIVRDYLENVRGSPEMSNDIASDYLDNLWSQASDFARRNGIPCPVHREEVEALRLIIESRIDLLGMPVRNERPKKNSAALRWLGWS